MYNLLFYFFLIIYSTLSLHSGAHDFYSKSLRVEVVRPKQGGDGMEVASREKSCVPTTDC